MKLKILTIVLITLIGGLFLLNSNNKGDVVKAQAVFSPPEPTVTVVSENDVPEVKPDFTTSEEKPSYDGPSADNPSEESLEMTFGKPNCQKYQAANSSNKWVKAIASLKVSVPEAGELKMYEETLGDNPGTEEVKEIFFGRPELVPEYLEALKLAIQKCDN